MTVKSLQFDAAFMCWSVLVLSIFICFRNDICVDIVANGGRLWVKVVARNAAALHVAWSGQGQYGERNLMNAAKDYVRIACSHPVDYQTPKVVFYFTNGVPIGLSKELSDIGVLVDGELVDCTFNDSSSEENDVEKLSETFVQTIKLGDFVRSMSDVSQQVCTSEISRVNLDISTMLTLISNLSNGFHEHVFGIPVLDEQASQERNCKVLPKLQTYLSNKTLLACETAVNGFKKIVHLVGGPKEKERAKELLKTITTVADNPSQRTLKLISSSKLNKRAKVRKCCYYLCCYEIYILYFCCYDLPFTLLENLMMPVLGCF